MGQDFQAGDWVSQAEAARIRGVSRQAIARLVKKERFKTLEIGGRLLLQRSEIENYQKERPGRPVNERKGRKHKRVDRKLNFC